MNPLPHNPDLQQMEIEEFANMINSSHKPVQFEGLTGIKNLLSRDNDPPIQKVVDSGIVPKILEMMAWEDDSQFQMESSWCILNICSTSEETFTDFTIELGGLDLFISLINSPIDDILDNAVWFISNLLTESTKYVELCLEKDCMDRLLQRLYTSEIPSSVLDNIILSISKLCQGNQHSKILEALPVLYETIRRREPKQAVISALRGLASLSDTHIQEVIHECGRVGLELLVDYLCEDDKEILDPALRIFGSLLAGDEDQADVVLGFENFLPRVFELTENNQKLVRKEAFWAISNIAAGTLEQIEMIIENRNYIERLKTAVTTEKEDIAKEAGFALCNMISIGKRYHINLAVNAFDLLETLNFILKRFDKDLKKGAIEAIQNILERERDYTDQIKKAGLLEIIQDLTKESEFSEEANLILGYFDQDEDVENPEENDDSEQEAQEKKD